ncbi:MAG: M4 family metallopeptidase [Bacteroidota bacterium]
MKRTLLFTGLACLMLGSLWAQERAQKLPGIQKLEVPIPVSERIALLEETLPITIDNRLELVKTFQDEAGFVHEKHQQVYQGLKVEGGAYTLHTQNGLIQHMSGHMVDIQDLSTVPSIDEGQALNFALRHVDATKYVWDGPGMFGMGRPKLPQGELVILSSPYTEDDINLAYKFDVYATEPLYRAWVYVDAHTGKVIFEDSRIHHANVAASGTSLYNGTVNFTADYTGSLYRLRQTADGGGIQTFDMNNGTNYNNASDFTNGSSSFTASSLRTGVQAHYGAEQTHKYFLQKHNRNSFNGTGGIIRSYVSYSNNYVNAFWNGSVMTYGDGDGVNYGPLVSLDIVGHEIAHGVTDFSADLVYSYESGALNESFSDIFGEAIENFATGANDWRMGTDMGIGGSGAIRAMDSPNLYGDPDTYGGTNWYTGSGDNGGVHINSGVQNKWFYILVVGETGTNDLGNAYSVPSIGMDAAAAIAYRNLSVYLSVNSQYSDARAGAIQSAIDLYGAGSPEEIAVTDAWYAVGVGAPYGPPQPVACNTTVSSFPYGEGFESGLGNWSQDSDDDFDWTRRSGGTPSNGTGPSSAGVGTYYMYMETSSPNYPSKDAKFNSPCFNLTSLSSPQIDFKYHMTGTAVGTLRLQASEDGASWTTIWSESGDQGTAWLDATVDLSAYTNATELRLRFYGTSGSSWSGDMCVDAISVSGGSGGPTSCVSSFPYTEGFESGEGWSQAGGDDFDWSRRAGGTPSSNTGPSGAASGSYYMYTEASSPNYPSRDAYFVSPCFDLSLLANPSLSFDYHMYGATIGTLRLQASTNGGSSWTTVWSLSGNQGNSWQGTSVDLTAYAGNADVTLRFYGTTGSSYTGDMCVDNLNLDEGVPTPTCPAIDFSSNSPGVYDPNQDAGTVTVQNGGTTILLQNNAWKSIPYNYTVTSSTVLEFEFRSTTQGEIHGIGFDSDASLSSNLTFKVHGTQNWGITNYDNYSGSSWVTYTIPVGSYYTGSFNRLFFVCDKDASPQTSNGYFRNVKVYEGSCGSLSSFVGQQQVTPIVANEGEWTFNLYPNPTNDQLNLELPPVADQVQVIITDVNGRALSTRSFEPGLQQLDISKLASGVYMVKVQVAGEAAVVEKFVKM